MAIDIVKKKTLQEIIKGQFEKCAVDESYFMKKYCLIQHPTRGRIPFTLYLYQESCIDTFKDHQYNIILKSRQLGLSTLIAGYSLHKMIFKKDYKILVIATGKDTAINLINKVTVMYNNLPSWMRVKPTALNKMSLELSNGSSIRAVSSKPERARSESLSLLIIDEAAFVYQAHEIWTAAQQTLACVDYNTILYTDNGLYRIGDLKTEKMSDGFNDFDMNIISDDGIIKKSNSYFVSKKSKVFEIMFEDGNSIITTENHPLLTDNGWVMCKDLTNNIKIKCVFNTNTFGERIIYPNFISYNKNTRTINNDISNEDLAYFYGLYIAEGNRGSKKSKNSQITITNTDKQIHEFLINKFGFHLYSNKTLKIFFANLSECMKFVGIGDNTAKTKCVPCKILSSSRDEQIYFLRGLFEGDGCALKYSIKYTTVSKQLALDLYNMLLNFGIKSRIKYIEQKLSKSSCIKVNDDYIYRGYELFIYGKYARKFMSIIGFGLDRKRNRFVEHTKNGDYIKVDKFKIKSLIKNSGISFFDFNKNIVDISRLLWFNSNCLTEDSINKILNNTNKSLLEWMYLNNVLNNHNSNVFYNKIKSIKYINDRITYDIKVPDGNAFIANGIVNHNTGGDCVILSTPNGQANWFYDMWTEAEEGLNGFYTTKLKWNVHPERDQSWRDDQDRQLGKRKAAQECFSGDVRIYTNRGLKRINEIKIGDMVLSHNGEYKEVIRLYKKEDSDLYEIKNSLNFIAKKVTKNHPFYQDGEFKEVKNIKNKSYVHYFPKNEDLYNIKKEKLDLYEMINPKYFKKVLCEYDQKFFINDRKHKKIHNRFVEVDYDLGYLIGIHLSEGYLSRLRWTITHNVNETNTWVKKIIDIIENKFNLNSYQQRIVKSWGIATQTSFCSEVFCSALNLFVEGKNSDEKRLSEFSYSVMNKEFMIGIVDGLFDGDRYKGNLSNATLKSTSEDLIYDAKFMLEMCGFHNISIKKIKRKKGKSQYSLSLLGTKNHAFNSINELNEINYFNSNKILEDNDIINSLLYKKEIKDNIKVFNIEVKDDNSYVTEYGIVHNCDADFLTSGNSIVDLQTIMFYEETYRRDPEEKRSIDKGLWIWGYPDYTKTYLIAADVARGDGSDYSTCHVFDIKSLEQVAEYKGRIGTRDFGRLLAALGIEYNNAMVIVERENVGWDTLQELIDINYPNLFYSSNDLEYVEVSRQITNKLWAQEKKLKPGFATTSRNRGLLIQTIERYFGDQSIIIHSVRLLNELKNFIWINGKAQAQSGKNDDLVMALGILLWVRDTALRLREEGLDITRMTLDRIKKAPQFQTIYQRKDLMEDPYKQKINANEMWDTKEFL